MVTADSGLVADLAAELAKRGIELGPVIGRGAMGVVYRAYDTRHDRSVAVKVLSPEAADQESAARWTGEISAVARLRHPNILPLIDSGATASGAQYFLMPLADGEMLRARLERGPLPIMEAVRYTREVAEALAYAHAEGLVHRDVKPENILIEGGRAVLVDFGLARWMNTDASRSRFQSQAGRVVGTPAYMSPEQLAPTGPIDGRADAFSLGIVLYEMLTGAVPFPASGMPGLLTERLAGRFEPVTALRPEAPALLDRIVSRALAPDPMERYDRVEAMVTDLIVVEHQLSGAAAASSPRFRSPRWGLVAGGVVALAAVAVALVLRMPVSSRLDPNRIAVADMQNVTDDTGLAVIGAMASDWISAGLTTIPGLKVINSDFVFGAPRSNSDRRIVGTTALGLRALVDSTHAGTVVSGSYYRESGRLVVFAEITDARSGQLLLDLGPFRGPFAHPDSALSLARDSVTAFIRARRAGKES
jgi:serine/threonine-protein kinase